MTITAAENQDGSAGADGKLMSLVEQFRDPPLKSSARLMILVLLAKNKRMSYMELLVLTGLGKGNLWKHIDKLERSGYIASQNIKTFDGVRRVVEITPKGLGTCRSLFKVLQDFEDNAI